MKKGWKIFLGCVTTIILLFVIFIFLGYFLLTYHSTPKFYFQIEGQKIINCNNVGIRSLRIYNDSIKKDGLYEAGESLLWNNTISPPHELSLDSIPKGYGIRKIRLEPNCRYAIEESEYMYFVIRIWTDSTGRVYKTTHPKCGLESLTPE